MPAIAVAVAAAAASSAAAGLGIGGALFGAGILGSFGAAVLADTVFGALVGFAVSTLGNSLVAGGGKKSGGAIAGSSLDSGVQQVVRLSSDSRKIVYGTARIGGTLAYIETASTGPDSSGATQNSDNLFLHMVVAHCDHEIESFEEFYLNDELVTIDVDGFVNEDRYKKDGLSYVRIVPHLGSDTQLADSLLMGEAPNWTSDHRLRGIAYSYVRLQWNPDVFTGGIPTFNVVIKGKKVYDPRTTLTEWSDNAALVARDYLTSRDFSDQPYGFGVLPTEIDDDFTSAAANICEEEITKLDASTIDRYTCNGVVDTANAPLDNMDAILSAMIGTVTCPKGSFRIYAGAYDTPESTVIDESWLHGKIDARLRIPRQELFNAVRGEYVAPDKQWQADSFPAITSATYEAEDADERIYTEIKLPFTTDPEAAQRIAQTMLRKGREQISCTMPCNYKALQFAVWDVIKIDNETLGWSEKVFRIVGIKIDLQQGVVLQLREENSVSYDWEASDGEAVDAAPDTDLPSPFIVEVPSSVAYDSRAVLTVGGDTVYNLVLTWAPYTNAFVTNGGLFEVQFKLSSEADWHSSFFVSGEAVFADIPSTTPNIEYDLRVRAINMLGAKSNWVTILEALIGSSGGVISSLDWGSVAAAVSFTNDWDSVAASVSFTNDWGSVV